VHLRPLARGDIDAVHRITRSCETADSIPIATPREEVAEMFDETHFDPATDGRVVEVDGEPVAWLRTWHEPSGVRLERVYLSGHVEPQFRRRGIGRTLVAWGVARATEQLHSHRNGLPLYVRSSAFSWQDDVAGLYAAAGFEAVRWDAELLRPLAEAIAEREVAGIEIVPWAPSHHEACRKVSNAAFADHWGSTPRSEVTWLERLRVAGTRVDLSFVALAAGKVVGLSLNAHYPSDELVTGRRDGWIGTLAVLREWRHRGIGSALIERSLRAFVAEGLTHAMLGVDTENQTGAVSLYRALGFEPLTRSTTFELAVPAQSAA
jgi:mycothiol synthase